MAKIRIIRSGSLECLRGRINNKIMECHRMLDQLDEENQLIQGQESKNQIKHIQDDRKHWQTRIECYRDSLNDIALFESEIEI